MLEQACTQSLLFKQPIDYANFCLKYVNYVKIGHFNNATCISP